MVNVNRSDKAFNNLIKIFTLLMLFHCILVYAEIVLPIALLYGPVHISLHRISTGKKADKYLYIQFIPFLLMTIFYCVLYYSMKSGYAWGESLLIYYPIYFICIMLSSFVYSIYIWKVKRDENYKQQQLQLVLQLATIAFVIGIFIGIRFLCNIELIDEDVVGFDPMYIICGLLFLSIGIMISYLATERKKNTESYNLLRTVKLENEKYNTFSIEDNVLKEYAVKLEKAINDKSLYLNAGLSLDDLLTETGIPKHHLSQLFNTYFGRTFYQYIADRRIKEAISRIEGDDNITLESLAYECGFNSKTSFNRYFKETTGMTPSEYRVKCETF